MSESWSFERGPTRLKAQAWGDSNKPLLLCLHGWLDNSETFAPLAQHLANDYYLLCPDWPGHGHSDHRPGQYPYQWADYLLDLACLLEQLPKAPVAIVGHSLGGIIAAAYLAIEPQAVERLVLIESFGPVTGDESAMREQLLNSVRQHQSFIGKSPSLKPVDLDRVIAARAKVSALTPEQAAPLVKRNLEQREQRWYWRSDPRLKGASPIKMSQSQAQQLMAPLDTPTLLIQGADSEHKSWRYALERQSWLRQLTKGQVAGGHHCHMQSGEAVAQAIIEWLENR
ncbi:alpha/beta fold hydrolase [Paraferrimonas sedimenticola]|uniref:Alpha/beta hydrolase n=1 Tax=Paraferrimonas sedimenticola TaxID=375674 RepID=A0AA37W1N7_9GAMM|nr:alpha/beta hydrolase [Paraferrimonas sedimenticola]GLP96507.1 alpha/beta hydrolase [Paraferrimonas sedimenticola]